MSQPNVTINLDVEINYCQVYIYSVPWQGRDNDAVLRALNDARQSDRFVGVADGLIDLVTSVQWNPHAPMRIETWMQEPPDDDNNWDHVVDVDLDVTNDRLHFEGSGGCVPIPCEVPSGTYRARVSGRGYAEAAEGAEGMDSYRIRLWHRAADSSPEMRKRWPGLR
jgi:hypothetical protein